MDDKTILKGIADNPALFEAVKRTVLSYFSLEDLKDINMPNEVLGQFARSRIEGREKIESAFRAIAQCKTVAETLEKQNPAR